MKLAKSATEDDFFRCQQYLFDYDAWLFNATNVIMPGERAFMLILAAAEAAILAKIHYFEAMGCRFEPPDFWVTRQQMAELVDSGEWQPTFESQYNGVPQATGYSPELQHL